MTSTLILFITKDIFNNSDTKVFTEHIFTDTDFTIRTYCNNVRNRGKLPGMIPQPKFLTYPIHEVKVIYKPIFKLVTYIKDPGRYIILDPLM